MSARATASSIVLRARRERFTFVFARESSRSSHQMKRMLCCRYLRCARSCTTSSALSDGSAFIRSSFCCLRCCGYRCVSLGSSARRDNGFAPGIGPFSAGVRVLLSIETENAKQANRTLQRKQKIQSSVRVGFCICKRYSLLCSCKQFFLFLLQ